MSDTIPVDVGDVAARIRREGARRARVSVLELAALAMFVERELVAPQLLAVDPVTGAVTPLLTASLASAIAEVLARFECHRDLQANQLEHSGMDKFEALLGLEEALNTLKSRFEEEFPNDGSR